MFRNGVEPWHIIVIALVVLVLFGGKKLPEAARGLGRSLRIFKSEMKSMNDDDATTTTSATPAAPAAPSALPPTTPVDPAVPGEAAGNTGELRPETPPRVDG